MPSARRTRSGCRCCLRQRPLRPAPKLYSTVPSRAALLSCEASAELVFELSLCLEHVLLPTAPGVAVGAAEGDDLGAKNRRVADKGTQVPPHIVDQAVQLEARRRRVAPVLVGCGQ